MIEIECLIKNIITTVDNEYYEVVELKTKEEHRIPVNQLSTLQDINHERTYFFLKEYNKVLNKTFLNYINPNFKIGTESFFEIEEINEIAGKKYFSLKSDFIKKLTVKAHFWQYDFKKIKCKVIGYKRGIPVLSNIDTTNAKWTIGDSKYFKIKGFSKKNYRNGDEFDTVVVYTENEKFVEVRSNQWQRDSVWTFQDLHCEIIGLDVDCYPKLKVIDNRHPFFNIGEKYKFTINNFCNKLTKNNKNILIINLTDENGYYHEVMGMLNQDKSLKIGDSIECEVINIDYKLFLKQVEMRDPFFYTFESIATCDKYYKKYFEIFLNEDDYYNSQLQNQYSLKSGFWVMTYCNYILPKLKYNLSQRKNFNELLEVIELHNKIEEWILNKGLLKSITDETERKKTKIKIIEIIGDNKLEILVVNEIINYNGINGIYNIGENNKFKYIFNHLIHNKFDLFDDLTLIKFLSEFKGNDIVDRNEIYLIRKILAVSQKNKKLLIGSITQDYFILSSNNDLFENKNLEKFLNWVFIELTLYKLINLEEEANILLAQFYRFYFYLENDVSLKKKLLLNSFYVISNSNNPLKTSICFVENKLIINYDSLIDNPNIGNDIKLESPYLLSKIIQKHKQGCNLLIENTNGFLPYLNITDPNLKNYNLKIIDWSINVEITLYCNEFRYFISKQLAFSNENYLSNNNINVLIPKINSIIYVTVKDTQPFGVFVETDYGDGLIHLNNVSTTFFERGLFPIIFKKGRKIPAVFLKYEKDKIELSLKDLIGTEYEEEYWDILENFKYVPDEDILRTELNDINFKVEEEKGYIFEQYATLQNNLQDKIKYIKFAKAFFSNTKSARSYLLNIYIDYFLALIRLDKLISDYSFDNYEAFRKDILLVKEKIDEKTLETFPESKNLVFFSDILNLFNSQKEEDLESLFNLTKNPFGENNKLLKTVAKNALANNLIISDVVSSELDDFTLKNLKRIREFITQGVLSVQETIEDKLKNEQDKRRVYIKSLINEDEGPKLEFKATFFTPIPNEEKIKIIKNIEKKISKCKNKEESNFLKLKVEEIHDQTKNVPNIQNIIIHSALKTICAFANTTGGYLLLGVSDDKKIFGLEKDYSNLKKSKGIGKERDDFAEFFDQKVKEYFGNSFSPTILEKEFLKFPEGDILIINVKPSIDEIHILKNEKGQSEETIYVRHTRSSEKLKGIELSKFIKNKFRDSINITL
ncbi:RNA-binding domain-containing protein [Flavobacterium sp. SM2513]|uniref:RNA-binding domain-containing protein n=1 Tax=Flavobacterium sp. SM2513 TaxID=3424766 RepID=UPI003D7F8936